MSNDNSLTAETLFAHYKALLARTRGVRPAPVVLRPPPAPAPTTARARVKVTPPPPEPRAPGQRVPNTKGARRVLEPILRAHELTWDDIIRDDRHRPLVMARREIYFALRELGWSLPSIAQLCERDHTSVLYAIRKWENYLKQTNETGE